MVLPPPPRKTNQNINTKRKPGIRISTLNPSVSVATLGALEVEAGQEVLEGGRNVDGNGLVVRGQSIGEVGKRLAVINDLLAANLQRKDTLVRVAVGLLAKRTENWHQPIDGGAHPEFVVAALEVEVVDVNAADLVVQEIVVEGNIALEVVSKLSWENGSQRGQLTRSKATREWLGMYVSPQKLLPWTS